ncbi:MAG: SsrA-binding protein SmpB [Oceanospirillaceae bacterium]|nr:SsrA-binding protein SmpB [Oceanospirillaceae bacterium]MBT4443951.1 SsrA-binding protein SmpB [Oceanospirillaceae bacterium]MBT6077484.1 SsrA-binding protein SmpB [Oceanospirillaceae bacterium]MBT7329662.1 SsrA-binding protein SmpB [Oceanospirillaceae bacterium]
MAKKSKTKKSSTGTIALNKRAKFEYHLDQRIEAGLVLTGWEIKSIRDGRANLTDSYVHMKGGEAFLVGAHISPLMTACTHVVAEPRRERKLLLNKKEIARLFASSSQTGHTIVATALYWKGHRVKCEIALAKGKQLHDKRATEKERDWSKQKHRILMKA